MKVWIKKTNFFNLYNSSSKVFQNMFCVKDTPFRNKCFPKTLIFIAALITAVILYLLFLPIHLLLLGISCCRVCEPSKDKRVLLTRAETPSPTITTLIGEEQQRVKEIKNFINDLLTDSEGRLRKFNINMSPSSLRKSPTLSPFLKDLTETVVAACDYKKLKEALIKVDAWDTNWSNIMIPYFESVQREIGHPDQETFPILMHFLLRALNDPAISKKEKQQSALFISSSAYACKPTWAEVTCRALTKLYSKSDLGENQLLIWVQEVKEKLLLMLHENRAQLQESRFETLNPAEGQFGPEEWHIINGMKRLYGEEFGLMIHHLQPNLMKLTLRQTVNDLEQEQYNELCQTFKITYQNYGMQLIQDVLQIYRSAEPSVQTLVRNYALSLVEAVLSLPGTSATHTEIFLECLCDEDTYDLNEKGIAYLLFILEIIQLPE
ncbi:DUF1548 domain-containing protein [Chlamydia sp. 17-3921]|uniref:DUF1548 domain-containing protein n=1 Tax=Chlamydia sp. 17-3921 TaxID=2675798 RepID=UPI00191B2789|nr:DUF1548 domain-containing protein [Chlamydia sp. 17-3921]